ncbi:MAG: hypothetical protein M1370_12250 [Bacteroidetes bacterium]|nr:hypothetical protein [Bacteroidota bacterium]
MNIMRAILHSFNAGTYTATVQVVCSRQTYLASVPVSRAIPSGQMIAGRECAVLFYDQQNPADGLILGVH